MGPIEARISQKLKELFGSTIIPSLMAAVSGGGRRRGRAERGRRAIWGTHAGG